MFGFVEKVEGNLNWLSFVLQYADPVADLLDKWGVFKSRLFRESCVFHRGNYVKVNCWFLVRQTKPKNNECCVKFVSHVARIRGC